MKKIANLIRDEDIVICSREVQKYLQEVEFKNKLIKFKMMDYPTYFKTILGEISSYALIALQKDSVPYEYAKVLVRNYLLKKYLKIENNAIKNVTKLIESYFSRDEYCYNQLVFKKTYFINADKSNDYLVILQKILPNYEFIDLEDGNAKIYLTCCNTVEVEIINLINRVSKKLLETEEEIVDIYIPSSEYLPTLYKMLDFYQISYTVEPNIVLYDLEITKKLIIFLDSNYQNFSSFTNLFEEAIRKLEDQSFVHLPKLIAICNEFIHFNISDYIYIRNEIISKFKNTKIDEVKDKSRCRIHLKLPELIYGKIFYIVGVNQNQVPVFKTDDDFFSDKIKEEVGLFSSTKKNLWNIEKLKRMISSTKECFISYSLDQHKVKSTWLAELENINLLEPDLENIASKKFDNFLLGKSFDIYDTYGVIDNNIHHLYNDDIAKIYHSYNNQFSGTFKLNDPLSLSYTKINLFYECAYHYYLDYVLRINKIKDNEPILIGNYFHEMLRKLLEEKITIESLENETEGFKSQNEILKTKQNEYYFNRYLEYLKQAFKYITSFHNRGLFNEIEYETLVEKTFGRDLIKGIIDKKMSFINNNEKYVALIDYKTGSTTIELAKLEYGLNMQIPYYFYLLNDQKIKFIGGYLQKIIPSKIYLNDGDKTLEEQFFEEYQYLGYTTSNQKNLTIIDKEYQTKSIIRGLKATKNGIHASFFKKTFNDDEFEKIKKIVDEKILNAIQQIHDGKFMINPKIIDQETTCKNCPYISICFRKYADFIKIKLDKDLNFIRKERL